jgi:pilus assembly protein CpaE
VLGRIARRSKPRAGRRGRIVSFVSNKGGVGKSTLALNAACGLAARHPEQVLLIDASLQLGVCASMLDLQPVSTITDAAHERDRLDETLIRQLATPHDSGLHLLAAPADPLEAAEVDDEVMSRILTLARRAYDYVIVDTFPMFDRVIVAVLDLSDRCYVVLENVVPTLLGGVKLIKLMDELGFPRERERVILNRSTNVLGSLKPGEVAQRLGREIDLVLPYEKKVIVAANMGRPYIQSAGRLFGYGRGLHRLVHEIERLPAQRGKSANGQGELRVES